MRHHQDIRPLLHEGVGKEREVGLIAYPHPHAQPQGGARDDVRAHSPRGGGKQVGLQGRGDLFAHHAHHIPCVANDEGVVEVLPAGLEERCPDVYVQPRRDPREPRPCRPVLHPLCVLPHLLVARVPRRVELRQDDEARSAPHGRFDCRGGMENVALHVKGVGELQSAHPQRFGLVGEVRHACLYGQRPRAGSLALVGGRKVVFADFRPYELREFRGLP
mmetsp:Transcript_60552/g.192214  ORF Transcript_60552/g.192214 Transcript_60552/m.192214 type:complete len:219 (-) Transcript_60552:23-679(-)